MSKIISRIIIFAIVVIFAGGVIWYLSTLKNKSNQTTDQLSAGTYKIGEIGESITVSGKLTKPEGAGYLIERDKNESPLFVVNITTPEANGIVEKLKDQNVTVKGRIYPKNSNNFYVLTINNQTIASPKSTITIPEPPTLKETLGALKDDQKKCLKDKLAGDYEKLLDLSMTKFTLDQSKILAECTANTKPPDNIKIPENLLRL